MIAAIAEDLLPWAFRITTDSIDQLIARLDGWRGQKVSFPRKGILSADVNSVEVWK